ncbi:Hypothetical predicted protein [Cloeon dipterum]|uniref:HIG1 domain-containing protein n=1 Tax=Cloeon dipterum TaxID=197152 RepID=A0A8S1D4N2_9INSE|nr:Hypothetical predicted protein [Cloeon dipterum]
MGKSDAKETKEATSKNTAGSKDDDYTSEFDWIQIRQKIENYENIQEETFTSKLKRKFGENPLVPIGAFATMGALTIGLWNFRLGKKRMSQNMMRLRIAAQGFTVVALVSGMFLAATATANKGAFIPAATNPK